MPTLLTKQTESQMKLPKETRFYYLDYIQKQIYKVGHDLEFNTFNEVLKMIDELTKEDEEDKPETLEGEFIPTFHD